VYRGQVDSSGSSLDGTWRKAALSGTRRARENGECMDTLRRLLSLWLWSK